MAHPLTKKVEGKRLYDCELIGPANIFAYRDTLLNNITFFDCTFIVLWPDKIGKVYPGNAILFDKVEMHGGTIYNGLCCTNPVRDSSCESSVVAGRYEQTDTPRLQDQELAGL